MTDKANPETTEKTVAELEAEARERARSAMVSQAPEQNTPPGQPEVTRFKKSSSRRTLLVSLLSLGALIALALGGDRFLVALKQRDDKSVETPAPPSANTGQHERKNLGMDNNPFGLFGQGKQEPATDNHPIQTAPPSEPPALNKAAALVDGSSSAAESTQRGNTQASQIAPSGTQSKDTPATMSGTETNDANPGVAKVTSVRRLGLDPNLYLPVDRYIPCSMMRRFVSDVGGRISCLIGEDVYSANHYVKLLPAGTVARGFYRTGALQHGRSRMFVIWTELRTPEPGSLQIPLVDTEATGPLGEAGISGWIDTHFWERFGNALMLSTVQDVAAAASDSAPGKDRNTDYTENTRAAASEMAKTALENSISIPPTMYLNQGDVIGIMTGTDIDFSSVYQLHLKKRWYER
ncbi:VirB10/TraB/TrbI family type IV secretion system protein [Pectobacterium brasiliense]|uniref:TrbI/VirB10 family protein n=2 Tax=Pectobacterium brasiliense TaxID=180957 RepID=A0A433NGV9_9GAMM|nr:MULTISPECIES: VirB10/TraB/TrbI family type IV secretion system protein [Pectobacterium]GKW26946.1 type VI secretion protein [Pectobacterium carotovorum subsp. carotovorum]MBN3047777.1 TrbI/VirB10 family protein [Pectobacterium brasiliense]MBN3076737.1 TrbI/VirB10 family protein [Pectobacterium brasiliense]MBN3084213.1 TrbI/VirB10 family protein [Pectobacterium brasiliense]MBN3088476.1 TrbI/VirB10 family protein [Pectobacterium brasiliense]